LVNINADNVFVKSINYQDGHSNLCHTPHMRNINVYQSNHKFVYLK